MAHLSSNATSQYYSAQPSKDSMRPLPKPMDYKSLSSAMLELGVGMRKAVETCLDCWKAKRLSDDDLISFLRSIKGQSKVLTQQFDGIAPQAVQGVEIATADEMAELRALAGLGGFGGVQSTCYFLNSAQVKTEPAMETAVKIPAGSVQTAQFQPQQYAVPLVARPLPAKPQATPRRAKNAPPSTEEQLLMEQWRTRRATEVKRRQIESGSIHTTASYLKFVVKGLASSLPAQGKGALLQLSRSFNTGKLTPEDFGIALKNLVDQFSVTLCLSYSPEHLIRQPTRSRAILEAVELDDAEPLEDGNAMGDLFSSPSDTMEQALFTSESKCDSTMGLQIKCESAGVKRKRSPTGCATGCTSHHEAADDESAVCPVCSDAHGMTVDDERWVKCDGCSTWYHQICVLFNEPAHGKSVRFFCRTPGCRKRGSRQLNRRMRKPCYPMSPGLDATPLGDRISLEVAPLARSDRPVVVRTVASRASADGDHVRRTVMAFQHTLIGSDLIFLTMFLEEHRSQGRLTITHIDSNGHYEEAEAGERRRVEAGVVQSLLRHAKDSGFVSARVCLASLADGGVFHSRAAGMGWCDVPTAAAECAEILRAASAAGVIHSYTAPSAAREPTFSVRLQAAGAKARVAAAAADDLPCPMALSREDLLDFMRSNIYRFDTLQMAKYSSMMIVYHLAKGWKKESSSAGAHPHAARTSSAADAHGSSDEEEEECGDATAVAVRRAPAAAAAAHGRSPAHDCAGRAACSHNHHHHHHHATAAAPAAESYGHRADEFYGGAAQEEEEEEGCSVQDMLDRLDQAVATGGFAAQFAARVKHESDGGDASPWMGGDHMQSGIWTSCPAAGAAGAGDDETRRQYDHQPAAEPQLMSPAAAAACGWAVSPFMGAVSPSMASLAASLGSWTGAVPPLGGGAASLGGSSGTWAAASAAGMCVPPAGDGGEMGADPFWDCLLAQVGN